MMTDLRSIDEDLTGKEAAILLEECGVTLNRNSIPFDPRPPFVTSGLRMGTPAITTQGMAEADCETVADLITRVLRERNDPSAISALKTEIGEMAGKFTPYQTDFSGHV